MELKAKSVVKATNFVKSIKILYDVIVMVTEGNGRRGAEEFLPRIMIEFAKNVARSFISISRLSNRKNKSKFKFLNKTFPSAFILLVGSCCFLVLVID